MNKVAHPFYGSGRWKTVRQEYLKTVHFMCEKCGKPAQQVHHIEELKEEDYFVNYEKCYGFKNLMALCRYCHNRMPNHFLWGKEKQAISTGYRVNMITGEIEVTPPISDLESGVGKPTEKAYEKVEEEN